MLACLFLPSASYAQQKLGKIVSHPSFFGYDGILYLAFYYFLLYPSVTILCLMAIYFLARKIRPESPKRLHWFFIAAAIIPTEIYMLSMKNFAGYSLWPLQTLITVLGIASYFMYRLVKGMTDESRKKLAVMTAIPLILFLGCYYGMKIYFSL